MNDLNRLLEHMIEEWRGTTLEDFREKAMHGGGVAYEALALAGVARALIIICVARDIQVASSGEMPVFSERGVGEEWSAILLSDAVKTAIGQGPIWFRKDRSAALFIAPEPLSISHLERMFPTILRRNR